MKKRDITSRLRIPPAIHSIARLSVVMALLSSGSSIVASTTPSMPTAPNMPVSKSTQKSYTVTGTVVDEAGEPLPGATVLIKGRAGEGTATDVDGHFILHISDPSCTLSVSYVGMLTKEVKASTGQPLDISLESSDNRLSEIVVTGYQSLS
ncbi:carboxypeptidase-like regulatory domain-containing protein, partial [uncultured Duncaniella sp.]